MKLNNKSKKILKHIIFFTIYIAIYFFVARKLAFKGKSPLFILFTGIIYYIIYAVIYYKFLKKEKPDDQVKSFKKKSTAHKKRIKK